MRPVQRMGILFGILLNLSLSSIVLAQVCNADAPNISMAIYLVDEKEVCPNGYVQNDSGEESNCPIISIRYIKHKIIPKYQNCYSSSNIPPSTISLNAIQRLIAYNYDRDFKKHQSESSGLGPDSRKAAIFVFKWSQPHNLKIRLTRRQTGPIPYIDSKTWTGNGDGEAHWIHHERGDTLWVANMVEWTLTLGEGKDPEFCWNFKLE